MFAVVEGPEGAGKTTLVARLAERMRAGGRRVVTVREPGGTPVAEAARRLVLMSKHAVSHEAELFLILAARADLVARIIRPALEAGSWVLADRFSLSTVAYQVHGRGLDEAAVQAANRLATGGLQPDVTLVLDVAHEVSTARQRRRRRGPDRLEREPGGFHERVFLAFRNAAGPGVVHIDGSGPIAEVEEAAWQALHPLLRGAGI